MKKILFFAFVCVLGLGLTTHGFSQTNIPDCMAYGEKLEVDNDNALNMKFTTKNGFRSRAHIIGGVTTVFTDRNGHDHFEIQIGIEDNDTIEIIYNQDFGRLPAIEPGMTVQACGEYITSYAPTGKYPASPSGALIHWLHYSPKPDHDDGFLVVEGKLYGFETPSKIYK